MGDEEFGASNVDSTSESATPAPAHRRRTIELWQKLREGIRNGSWDRAYFSMEQVVGVFQEQKQRSDAKGAAADPKDQFLKKLRQVDWSLGDCGDEDRLPSLCVSLLQHLTGKYELPVKMEEICYASSSVEWNKLTEQLRGTRRDEFLHEIVRILYPRDSAAAKSPVTVKAAEEQLIGVLRQYLQFEGHVHVIDESGQGGYTNKIRAELEAALTAAVNSGSLLLYRDQGGAYAPIVPRRTLFVDNWNLYADQLIQDLDQFRLLSGFFDAWLNRFIAKGVDWIRLYRKSQDFLEALVGVTTVEQVIAVMRRLQDGIDMEVLYPLEYLAQVQGHMTPEEVDELVFDLKTEVRIALCATTQGYSLELQERAGIRATQQQELQGELARNADRIRQQLKEETSRLKEQDDHALDYGAIKDDPEFAQLRMLYQERSWADFKSKLATSTPNATLSAIKVRAYRPGQLHGLYRKLLTAFELDDSDFPGLADRLSWKSPYDMKKMGDGANGEGGRIKTSEDETIESDAKELEKVLEQLSLFETTYDQSTGVVASSGTHVRLSQALVGVKNYLNANYHVEEVHIIAAGTVWLDVDVENEVGHGRNLYIIGDAVQVERRVVIDTSGLDGSHGGQPLTKPATPTGAGIHGLPGARGKDGESAGNVRIESMQAVVNLSSLYIRAVGGDGSDGQDGGDGSNGRNGGEGEHGQIRKKSPTESGVRLEFKAGKPGDPGQNGGDAGVPGVGGQGGARGHIEIISGSETIEVKPVDDEQFVTQDGNCGQTGKAGGAGAAGDGGAHGKDRAWATESALWYHPWTKYKGFLKAVYYDGWVHRGYTIVTIDPKPRAQKGNRGEQKNAQQAAQKQTATIAKGKRSINTKEVRAAFQEKAKHRAGSSAGRKLQEELDAAKSAFKSDAEAELELQKKRTEVMLENVQTELEGAAMEAKRAREEEQESRDASKKLRALDQSITERMNSEVSARVSSRLHETESVSIQIDHPPPNLEESLLNHSAQTPEEEANAQEETWSACADRPVCKSTNPKLEQEIRALQLLVGSLGVPELNRAFDLCMEQLLVYFEEKPVPQEVLSTISKLVEKGKVGEIQLTEIFAHKFHAYCATLYEKSNGRLGNRRSDGDSDSDSESDSEIRWGDLLRTNSFASSMETIFLGLHVARLGKEELEHFGKCLFNTLSDYNKPVQRILLDCLEQQWLAHMRETLLTGGEGFLQAGLAKAKAAKDATLAKIRGKAGDSISRQGGPTPHDVTLFFQMVGSQVLPVLTSFSAEFPQQYNITKLTEVILKNMDKEPRVIVQEALAELTKLKLKDMVRTVGKKERLSHLHRALLPHFVLDLKQLSELEAASAKPSAHADSAKVVHSIYEKQFKGEVVAQIEELLGNQDSADARRALQDFMELVEWEEGGLDYAARLEQYKNLRGALQDQASSTSHAEVVKAHADAAYAQLCAKVTHIIHGGPESEYKDMKSDDRRNILSGAIGTLASQLKSKTVTLSMDKLLPQLRGILSILKYEMFESVEGLRAVEVEFERRLAALSGKHLPHLDPQLLQELGDKIENLLAECWTKCLEWITIKFRAHYDVKGLQAEKDTAIATIRTFIETLSVDKSVIQPESVIDRLVLKVEILAHLCVEHGKVGLMGEARRQLSAITAWESPGALVAKVVRILDEKTNEFETSADVGNGITIADPRHITNYTDAIQQHRLLPLPSSVADRLIFLLIQNFSTPALAQFGIEELPKLSELAENRNALGAVKRVRRTKFGPPGAQQFCSEVKRFCSIAESVFNGSTEDLITFLSQHIEIQRARVDDIAREFKGRTHQRLVEFRECGRVCNSGAKTTISALRYQYMNNLRKCLTMESSVARIEDLREVEREAWAKVGRSQLDVMASGTEAVWLYLVFQRTVPIEDKDGLQQLTQYTITTLTRLQPNHSALRTVVALQAGFLQLLWHEEQSSTAKLKKAWTVVHSLTVTSLVQAVNAEEERCAENAIWAAVHSCEDLFSLDTRGVQDKGTARAQLQQVLRHLYFDPKLAPGVRQLILRIHTTLFKGKGGKSREIPIRKREFKATLNSLRDPTQSADAIREILHAFAFRNASSAAELLSGTERRYLQLAEGPVAHGKGKKLLLEFPLSIMREECPSEWLQNVLTPHYVQALLSALNVNQNSEAKARLSEGLTLWQSAVHVEATGKCIGQELQIEKWTSLLRKMVHACQVCPISFAQLNMCFLNASRASSLDQVVKVIEQHTSSNWARALYMVLIKERFGVLYTVKSATEIDGLLSPMEIHLVSAATNPKYVEEFLDGLLGNLTVVHSSGGGDVPEYLTMERIIRQIESQGTVDEMTIRELRGVNLGVWEDALRICTYRRKGIADPSALELCVRVEKKFRNTTEKFVDIVLRCEKNNLPTYLVKVRDGEWVLSKDLLDKLEHENDSIEARVSEEMLNVNDLKAKRLVEAFFDLGMNADICALGRLKVDELVDDLQQIREPGNRQSAIYGQTTKNFVRWDKGDIRNWVQSLAHLRLEQPSLNIMKEHKVELLTVIKVGVFRLWSSRPPRDTQILTVLCYLDSWATQSSSGRFGEIATSEGKTLITAMLATCLSLCGYNGNVITSSPILAVNAHEEMTALFELFGVQVSNICDEACKRGSGDSEQVLKRRYGAQVIYSDIGSLQGDMLRNENLGKTYARTGRRTDFMVVDEVDSMLLDKGSHVLYISHSIPELRHLKRIFVDIWNRVQVRPKNEAQALALEMQKAIGEGKVPYSTFLHDFIIGRLPIWINYAYEALEMERNDQFVVSTKVTVVDLPTGVEQASTQYSYGLHQFLQLKYGKKITAESLKAIFVSNMGYFNHHRQRAPHFKLFGLTGTMGCERSKGLLRDQYNVDFFKMPRYKFKRCVKYDGVIAEDGEAQLVAITSSISSKLQSQPILVICGNVKDAQAVETHLRQQVFMAGPDKRLFAYTSSKQDEAFKQTFTEEAGPEPDQRPCGPGDVIISTNLAGRGTDLPISEACSAGLHVILATMPPNERVEKQAFGRTSRKGKRGSTEYIVRRLQGMTVHTIEKYQRATSELETARIRQIEVAQMPQIKAEEELFAMFTKKFNALMNDAKVWTRVRAVGPSVTERTKKVYSDLIINRWAFWLDSAQTQLQAVHITGTKQLHSTFEQFWKTEVRQKATHAWGLCTSAADFVKLARAQELDGKVEDAVTTLIQALKAEPYYNEIAHYYLGVCLLKLDSSNKNLATRWLARHHLKIARTRVARNRQNLMDMQKTIDFSQLKFSAGQEGRQPATPPTKDVLLEVQFKNDQDLYERHLRVLDALLGTQVDLEFFKCLHGIDRDPDEAGEVLQTLLMVDQQVAEPIFKPIRLSRKVWLTKDGVLMFNKRPLEWPETLEEYREGLDAATRRVLERAKSKPTVSPLPRQPTPIVPSCYLSHPYRDPSAVKKSIDKALRRSANVCLLEATDFSQLVITKEELWKKLKEAGFLANDDNVCQSWVVNFDEIKFRELDLPGVGSDKGQRLLIGRELYSKHFRKYEKADFEKVLGGQIEARWDDIDAVLKKEGILTSQIDFSGKIAGDAYAKLEVILLEKEDRRVLKGLPESLSPWATTLEHMIIPRDPPLFGRQKHEKLAEISTSDLNHLLPYQPVGRSPVLNDLMQAGIVKQCAVDWALYHHFDKEKNRKAQIKDRLRSNILTTDCISELSTSMGQVVGKVSGLMSTVSKYTLGVPDLSAKERDKVGEGAAGATHAVLKGISDIPLGSNEHEMCAKLREVFRKRHPVEKDEDFKSYLKKMRKGLVVSVGSIKTLDALKVADYDLLDKAYSQADKCVQLPTSNLEELVDFYSADFERIPQVRRKLPWYSVGAICVAIFGVCQIVLGIMVAMGTLGLGANASAILISEGASDMIFAAHSCFSGSFAWKCYALYKVISVALSAATGGLAGVVGANVGARVGMEIGEEFFKFVLEKTLWTVGRYAAEALVSTFVGMGLEALLDHFRNYILTAFSTELKAIFLTAKFQTAMKQLRAAIAKMHNASYQPQQAESKLASSFELLRNKVSPYWHALHTIMRTLGRYLVNKVCQKVCKLQGRYGWAVGAGDFLLKLIGFSSVLTKGRMSTVFDFALEQVQKLTTHFEQEATNLRGKAKVSFENPSRSDGADFPHSMHDYVEELEDQLVKDSVAQLQQELVEPAMKEYTNRLMSKGFDSLFKGKQLEFDRAVRDASDKGSRFREFFEGTGEHGGLATELRREQLWRDLPTRSNYNNVWHHIPVATFLANCKMTVGDIINVFGGSILLIHVPAHVATATVSASVLGTTSAVFIIDAASAHLRSKAIEMGIPTLRRVQLI